MRERERERKKERGTETTAKTETFQFFWFNSQMPAIARAGPGQRWEPGIQPMSPAWMTRTQLLK